jgi:hypothetical protein
MKCILAGVVALLPAVWSSYQDREQPSAGCGQSGGGPVGQSVGVVVGGVNPQMLFILTHHALYSASLAQTTN